jgi:fused signal recognition particle receptor
MSPFRPIAALSKLKQGLAKTRRSFRDRLQSVLRIGRKLDPAMLDDLEEVLISMDIGVSATVRVMDDVREKYRAKEIAKPEEVMDFLRDEFKCVLGREPSALNVASAPPTVIMVVGVNGVGKTTSIAKLAWHLSANEGKKVLLAASDTFRAAAVEQLEIWSKRASVDIVKHHQGADPGAVAYDAANAAKARGVEFLIVDTAGRLHTSQPLMRELSKIKRVLAGRVEGGPHEVLLVLDATTGQNAIAQAKRFNEVVGVTGLFLAKLDGTAKGGIVLGLQHELPLPVKFVGVGEKKEDIEAFDVELFVDALFG